MSRPRRAVPKTGREMKAGMSFNSILQHITPDQMRAGLRWSALAAEDSRADAFRPIANRRLREYALARWMNEAHLSAVHKEGTASHAACRIAGWCALVNALTNLAEIMDPDGLDVAVRDVFLGTPYSDKAFVGHSARLTGLRAILRGLTEFDFVVACQVMPSITSDEIIQRRNSYPFLGVLKQISEKEIETHGPSAPISVLAYSAKMAGHVMVQIAGESRSR